MHYEVEESNGGRHYLIYRVSSGEGKKFVVAYSNKGVAENVLAVLKTNAAFESR